PALCAASISCASRNPENNANREGDMPQLPKTGMIHETIRVIKHSEFSYALYLPAAISSIESGVRNNPGSESRYPVILAFDPHGNGLIPVKKYRELAEKYGFILIGSNDSRNGLPGDQVSTILSAMFEEIENWYPVDSGQFYTMGFSGGARVSCIAAMMNHGVKGVIGCGAGFPQGQQPPLYKFDYFGMVGTADFNLNEMMVLDSMLTILGLRHFIATFNGSHEWPPAGRMEDAIQWNILNAMKDNRLNKDEQQIKQILASFSDRIGAAKQAKQLMEAAGLCKEAIQFSTGLTSPEIFKTELREVEQLSEYRKQAAYHLNILKKEQKEQQFLMNALFTQDLTWWSDRIKKLSARGMKNNPEDTLMNARLRSFLSLLCYSNVNAAMKQQKNDMAEKLTGVYQLADPANPEANYLYAVILIQRNDTTMAIRQLQAAISKGFSDKGRLLSQTEFEGIKKTPSFFDLVQKMK
ncbi:MAG: hypothetical protein WCI71_05850, partial [Bacteroidota bacterium]